MGQARTKQQVLDGIRKLTLQTNENGQYTHNAILLLQKGIRQVLQRQFNPSNPGKGIEKLLNTGDNRLTMVLLTNAITAGSVIKRQTKCQVTLNFDRQNCPPYCHRTSGVQEEADQLNVINQVVIGAKEGAMEAITKLVGSNITNTILCTANGSYHKSVNNFRLFDVMQVAINGADCPLTNDVLEQLLKVINHTVNFCKKISGNMKLLQSNAAQMAVYSIVIGIPQHVPTLLAYIKTVLTAYKDSNWLNWSR